MIFIMCWAAIDVEILINFYATFPRLLIFSSSVRERQKTDEVWRERTLWSSKADKTIRVQGERILMDFIDLFIFKNVCSRFSGLLE